MAKYKSEYSVVIFAHNLSNEIGCCIKSILLNFSADEITVYVMANGCTDSTENIVRSFQQEHTNIHLFCIPMADKANAWNHYVHILAPKATLHFFIDGDVEVELKALSNMTKTITINPVVNAIGGVPIVGRDRLGWINRMVLFGRISGGLYALSDSFLQLIRQQQVKLPIGFIGEDFLVSALAKNMFNFQGFYMPSPLLVIDKQAGFSFRQLSLLRIGDYLLYFRRLVRYRIRDYQLSMLINYVKACRTHTLPESVEIMYKKSHLLPHYYWRGKYTFIDWIAVFTIRKRAKKN